MSGEDKPSEVPWLDPRCSVLPATKPGPYVELGDGSLLTTAGNGVTTSRDEGVTWSAPREISGEITGDITPAAHVLLRTRNGVIVMVYMDMSTYVWDWDDEKELATGKTRLDVWSIRSEDEGRTWKDRQRILDGYCGALINIIQTSSGEIVVPVQDLSPDRTRHVQYTFASTDDGLTWKRSNQIDLGGRGHHDGAFEATVAELDDGRLLMLLRTSLDQFWQAFSEDKGRSWRVLMPSGLDASNSPGHLLRLSGGRLALVWNRLYREGQTGTRRTDYWPGLCERPCSLERGELSISFADGNGRTWSRPAVFVRNENKGACYPHIHERRPGELWISAHGLPASIKLVERDFA